MTSLSTGFHELSRPAAPVVLEAAPAADLGALRPRRGRRKRSGTHDGTGSSAQSLVKRAVATLRERILASTEDNRFLGSENELMEQLGVSRPTFRQAARLLEHEHLLTIKRGARGGYFAHPPGIGAVSQIASIYLSAHGTTLQQLHEATAPTLIEAAGLLARHPDRSVREQLQHYVDTQLAKPGENKDLLRGVLQFEQLIARLAGNPAIDLMINVMRHLARDARYDNFWLDTTRMQSWLAYARRLAHAIDHGDAEVAMLIVRRHTNEVTAWFSETTAKPEPENPATH